VTETADHIGVFEQGESIEATITGPDESYQVGLFNSDNRKVTEKETGRTVTFDADENSLDPGSYVLSITDPDVDKVVPIVVSGYDISVDLTKSTDNNELTIGTTATETALSGPPEGVEAVLWNDADQNRVELTKESESSSTTEYESTVPFSEFEGGSYEVYVVATGEDEMYSGNNEILGVSEPISVDVPDNEGSDDTGSNDGSNDDGSNGAGSDDESTTGDETNEDDKMSAGDETNQNETNEENETVVGNKTDTNENETDSSDNSDGEDQTDDDSSVIQPNNTDGDDATDVDNTSSSQTNDDTPHSPVIAIVALLLATLVTVNRQDN
jgi:hypothetical protein